MIILKIGGSALTNKKTGDNFVKDVSDRVSRELPAGKELLIVHGVGYIGHKLALKYKLHKGLQKNSDKWAHLRTEVKLMTKQIMSSLVEGGHSAVELSAASIMRTSQGKLVSTDYSIIKEFIARGFIPVLHGDGVIDDKLGLMVVSGDRITTELAIGLEAEHIIYGTDIDGILDSGGNVIPYIDVNDIDNIDIRDNGDFSGGLKNKIKETTRLKGIEVSIINLRKDGMLKQALENKKVGTTIRSVKK